ncbi:reverse transcriptase domain-containing protein [Micromonospora phytophila]|nr:reverse transcriptase/maturase family protein [Micromonospora phytophila]MCM0673344.1 reverse transcriptase domain-containing protein [Micromonospora phytophila]
MLTVGHRFRRPEPRRRVRDFVRGLLAPLPAKNCWTIAEHAGDAGPDGMQDLLTRVKWDDTAVRADVRAFRFLRLLRNMLQAGYLEDWTWNATLSGAPQGGVASPILSNIYLHRLDRFVETVPIPHYTRGRRRARNPAYLQVANELAKARRRGDRAQARTLRKAMLALPSSDPNDPGYRRLRYIRYADDHLLGFAGPKAEAEEIKQRLTQFLRDDLKLELNHAKMLITHARTGAARFPGYDVTVQHNDRKLTRGRRNVNGQVALRVPRSVIQAKCARYLQRGPPRAAPRSSTVTTTPSSRPTGLSIGASSSTTCSPETSNDFTGCGGSCCPRCYGPWPPSTTRRRRGWPANTRPKSLRRAGHGSASRRPCTAKAGNHWSPGSGIPLQRQKTAVIDDRQPDGLHHPRKELINRLLKRRCELCEQTGHMNVHHVRTPR